MSSSPAPTTGGGRAGWRDKSASAAAPGEKEQHWKKHQTVSAGWLQHRMKLAVALGALLLLIGYFIVTVLLSPKNTPLLLVGVFDFAPPFPPNAWASEDFARFNRTFLTEDGLRGEENIRVYSDLDEDNWRDRQGALAAIQQKLDEVKPGGPQKDAVLIYLSGHGMLDDAGRPCLVLPTRRNSEAVWQPQTGQSADPPLLDLQSVIDTIEQGFDAEVKKVVLLDCSRIESNPRLGILENRFNDELKNLQFKDNFFLLSSADAGQRGWVFPDLGSSAFGYFVCKGLEGRADGAVDGQTDKKVTLDELHKYLRQEIGQEVQARYMASQTPILLPARSAARAGDIRLAWSRPDSDAVEPGGKFAPSVGWERIDALWSEHSKLKERPGAAQNNSTARWLAEYKLQPEQPGFYRGADLLSFEAFQQGLLRLEQLNIAGQYYKGEAESLATSLEQAAKSLGSAADENDLPAALALRRVQVADEVQKQVEAIIAGPPTAKTPEQLAALQKLPYAVRAKAAWEYWLGRARLGSSLVDREAMRRTLDGVLGLPPGGSEGDRGVCDPVEIRFLRLLADEKYAPHALFGEQVMAFQAAILSRDLAEAAAWANDDDRLHYAVAQLVAAGDAARRKREDQVFYAPSDAATGRQWPEAEAQYKQALDLAVKLSAALAARDQAWQDLPYLAQWLVLRHATELSPDEAKEGSDRLANCKLLFADAHQLADQISRLMTKCLPAGAAPDEESLKQLVAATAKVSQGLSDLMKHHDAAIGAANLAGADNVLNRRRILDLLTTPLLTGLDRSQLRNAFLTRRNVQRLAGESKDAAVHVPLEDHPLAAFFAADSLKSDSGGRVAAELRAALKKRFDDVGSNAQEAASSATLRTDRVKLTAAEQMARESAVLWTLSPIYGNAEESLHDPLDSLRQFDRHHAIVWQAGRVLEDFWGTRGDPRNENYFAAYAKLARDTASRLRPRDESAAIKQLSATLNERQLAANDWAKFEVATIKLPPGDLPPAVEAHTEISVDKAKVPAGSASLMVQQGKASDWQMRQAAPFDKNQAALKLGLPAGLNPERVSWEAALFYRGHVKTATFGISRKDPGQVLEIARAAPVAPRIWVGGDDVDPGAITFIFDCSGSMNQAAPGGGPRMAAAKNAFREALIQLANAGNYRVSVWFFGHRLIYDASQKKVVPVCGFKNTKVDYSKVNFPVDWCSPETNLLSNDVAQEWPDPVRRNKGPAFLNKQNLPEVLGLLNAAQPAGTTPLYLSIVRAVAEDVNLRDANKPRRLIVITDGFNEVWEAEKNRTIVEARDVVTAINSSSAVKKQRIQLHVIGFGDAAQGGATWTKTILPDIEQPNNYYDTPVKASEIEAVIRKTCNLKQFDVDSDNEQIGRQKVPGEIVLNDHRGHQTYEVRVVGSRSEEQLPLDGGEAINLYMVDAESANPRLRHKRYNPSKLLDLFAPANRAAPGAAAGTQRGAYAIGFHPPLREGGFVNFPISIQNGDESKFSRRPAEAWFEITPVGGGLSNPRPLLFYDLQFEQGRPVPVLSCRTANWPAGAQRARINLFFKPEQTPTRRRLHVGDAEGAEPDSNLDVSLPGGGKVRFTVSVEALSGQNAARVTVVERCASEGDLRQAKVEIEPTGGAVVNRIRREYFHSTEEQEVRHSFDFLDKTPGDVRKFWVRVTSREELEKDAYKLDEPVEVTVLGRY